eukprot:07213.XXX_77528_77740_1 [CDS] Oithona nana genome sequencing.
MLTFFVRICPPSRVEPIHSRTSIRYTILSYLEIKVQSNFSTQCHFINTEVEIPHFASIIDIWIIFHASFF